MQRITLTQPNKNKGYDTYYLRNRVLMRLPSIRVDKEVILIEKHYLDKVLSILDRLDIVAYPTIKAAILSKANTPDDPRALVIEGISSSRTYFKVKLLDPNIGNAYIGKNQEVVYMPHTYNPGKHKTKYKNRKYD